MGSINILSSFFPLLFTNDFNTVSFQSKNYNVVNIMYILQELATVEALKWSVYKSQ